MCEAANVFPQLKEPCLCGKDALFMDLQNERLSSFFCADCLPADGGFYRHAPQGFTRIYPETTENQSVFI